ncbi:MAG: hypothetical protein EXS05_04195 [Planctomycetaceae bacterium]|nr:hypothetical protein [Planctomycetaceae bacterium]
MLQRILPYPMLPTLLRICPYCDRWFALRHVDSKSDPVAGRLLIYRCQRCHKEVTFAEDRPSGAM